MTIITAHILVKNEVRFVWYAVMSVIEHVDKVFLWDTGSTDGTVEIIKEIKRISGDKVNLRLLGDVTPEEFTRVRQEMLNKTKSDWFIIVDGDEVWWEDAIKDVTSFIQRKGREYESIANSYYSILGDIFHYQRKASGRYEIGGEKGHYNIRAIRNLPGLDFKKPHGLQGLYDKQGTLIQNRDGSKRKFIKDKLYMHFTNIPRSGDRRSEKLVPKRPQKLKYDLGISFPGNFYYPEVFFKPHPKIVPSPWSNIGGKFWLKSAVLYPLKLAKSVFTERVGY